MEDVLGLESKNSNNGSSADVEELSAIGAWLNHQRTNKKLTVAELSKFSGVAIPTIYAIESGRITNPRGETTKALEKALGSAIPKETVESVREEAEIEGIGEFLEFNPHNNSEHPAEGGRLDSGKLSAG